MREIKTVKKLRLITDAAILLILLGLASAMPAGGGLWSGGLAGAAGAAGAAVNRAYYSGNPDKPYVSLMINVYTGGEFIAPMMDVFDGYGVKATFFIGGSFAKNYPDIIREIARRGHELANHGYHHKDAAGLSYKTNFDEIIMAERQIEAICGIKTKLFAPPSGSIGGEMFKAAEALGYRVIMWSKDTIDWRDKDAELIFKRATRNMKNGDFVLMHPTAHTLEALPEILKFYSDNGYSAATVSTSLG